MKRQRRRTYYGSTAAKLSAAVQVTQQAARAAREHVPDFDWGPLQGSRLSSDTETVDDLGAELGHDDDEVDEALAFLPSKLLDRRSVTISSKQSQREKRAAALVTYPDVDRPATRADCSNFSRPCPFVSCAHHLYLDVNQDSGHIKLNYPTLEVWELKDSCSLDVSDRGGLTLEETGQILGLTRERVRQIEFMALAVLKEHAPRDDD